MTLSFDYTKDNHYKWGWGNGWYDTPNPQSPFRMHLGHTTREVQSFRNECRLAAKHIAEHATKPIIIGLSGGGDSQMACLSFLDEQIPFTAMIAKYRLNGDIINAHDIETAYEFCKKFNVSYTEYEIDIEAFFNSRGPELAKQYHMPNKAGIILQTAIMDYIGHTGCYIVADGDPGIHTIKSEDAVAIGITPLGKFSEPCWMEEPTPLIQHMIANNYEGTSEFFCYTPELMVSYLKTQVVQDYLSNFEAIMSSYVELTRNSAWSWQCYHYLIRPMMTSKEFPEIIKRRKFTGYEQIQGYWKASPSGAVRVEGALDRFTATLQGAVQPMKAPQSVVCSIENFIKYLTTPHTEEDVLGSYHISHARDTALKQNS